jgi:hypothetical protein
MTDPVNEHDESAPQSNDVERWMQELVAGVLSLDAVVELFEGHEFSSDPGRGSGTLDSGFESRSTFGKADFDHVYRAFVQEFIDGDTYDALAAAAVAKRQPAPPSPEQMGPERLGIPQEAPVVAIEDALRRFNRKERFILSEWLLAPMPFTLGQAARDELATVLTDRGVNEVPEGAFVAIDYHLDWLYAALCLHGGRWDPHSDAVYPRPTGKELTANHEDVDAIVAWSDPDGTATIVLIEAKAYTGWSNKQLQSKADRLGAIFGPEGDHWGAQVRPHLVLAGPKPSKGLITDDWPAWMRSPLTINLPGPLEPRSAVTRCDGSGTPSVLGNHVRIIASPWPGKT